MDCDVVMQMVCVNCHLSLGLGFLLGHFFGWLAILRAAGSLSPGDAQKCLVGPKLPGAWMRWGSCGRRVKCGQLGLICLPNLAWWHDPCLATAPALSFRPKFPDCAQHL